MQSKDLRIGNLVKFIDYPSPIDVQGICESQVEDDVVIIISDCEEFNIKDCTGILMSIDWLKAFNFKQDEEIEYTWFIQANKQTRFMINYNVTSGEFYFNNSVFQTKIICVHDLQNLYFALTKTELDNIYIPEP